MSIGRGPHSPTASLQPFQGKDGICRGTTVQRSCGGHLCCSSPPGRGNDYFPRFGRSYVNSTMFRIIGQAYSGDMPVHIAIPARRRDGETIDGGYRHGEVTFNVPVQCSIREPAVFDEDFLAGLSAAVAADSEVAGLLRTTLPFVELANTDDDFMTEHAEAILMGSAYEQLLRGDASKYKLCKKLARLFKHFGAVTVADAQKVRPGITIDDRKADRAAAQPKWWVHQKWIEEFVRHAQ